MIFNGSCGKYVIIDPEQPLASGGQATLWLGKNQRDSSVACLKVFVERQVIPAEMQREIDAMKKLQHPAILPILDYSATRKGRSPPFLVLPYCEGGNLRSALKEKQFIPAKDAVSILRPIAQALDYAHENGIIHGDIKPENILFRDNGQRLVVLADFGMSRHIVHTIAITDSTKRTGDRGGDSSAAGGTLAYMSPEQYDTGRVSARSDIFSLTVVAYEMLVGTFPYDADRPIYHYIRQRLEGDFRRPLDGNPNLASHVATALVDGLSPDPTRRPESASLLVDRIESSRLPTKSHQGGAAIHIANLHVGDTYSAGQAGAMGPSAVASHMKFGQTLRSPQTVASPALVESLAALRKSMHDIAEKREHYLAIAEIAVAEDAAIQGDSEKVLRFLRQAGEWALNVSEEAEQLVQEGEPRIIVELQDPGFLGDGHLKEEFCARWESTAALRIGRDEGIEVVLPSEKVSRCHAEIIRVEDQWCISDLGSKNGTYLNGVRLKKGKWLLLPGDRVTIGGIDLGIEFAHAQTYVASKALRMALAQSGT